ncbi:MAG: DNA (cytosine-5-)-methyltransferase [Ignavibacteriales bacterium]|nr:DNA (cytosine-5-)-methyltransferase [Ignavibacteriales bacterium]
MKIYKLGEMFCGPGGIAVAATRATVSTGKEILKIDHEWAIDYDKDTCATFRNNICPTEPHKVICTDVRKLKIEKLSPINCFAFGFPCNDFSIVGEKRGVNGEFGPLYTYGVCVLNHFQPDWFMAENVGGLQSADEGKTFLKILGELRNAGNGYRLTTHFYKFEEYGVPQTRHRIIIVGIRTDLALDFRVPAPTHLDHLMTAREAIENPPIPEHAENQELTKQSSTVVERLKHILPGENAWNSNLPSHLRLNVKGARISQIYRRLDPDKPAYTITGSGGGGTHGYHWEENRALTNRERARLQSFPDEHIFYGSKESVRRQIGMAVPPKGAQVILEAILKTCAGIAYPSIEPKWKEGLGTKTAVQLNFLNSEMKDSV